MENTLKLSGCGIHATLLALGLLGACNSDEIRLESASDSQGVTTDSATGTTMGSASMSATATDTGPTTGGTMSGSLSDSEAGSGTFGESHSTGMSASTTGTATDMTAASATDSTSTTDGTASETLGTLSDTDVTMTGTTDTGDTDTGEVCSPDVPDDNACEQCMAANCCEQYKACVENSGCSCLVDACSAPNAVPVLCAAPCALNPQGLMMALSYLMGCSEPCGAQCAALGLL